MKNVMDFEAIDWEAETKRFARAFGTENEWRFKALLAGRKGWLNVPLEGSFYNVFIFGAGALFIVHYSSANCQFRLEEKVDGLLLGALIALNWNGALEFQRIDWHIESIAHLTGSLARFLFHMDLLTPEIEAALKVSISAHEKLAWTFEYEARYEI